MKERTFRDLVHRLEQGIAKSPVGLPSPTTIFAFSVMVLLVAAFFSILVPIQQRRNEEFMQDAKEALGTDDFTVIAADLLIARTKDGRQFPLPEAVHQFYMTRLVMMLETILIPSVLMIALIFGPSENHCSNCGWYNYSFWHRNACPNCDLNYWLNDLKE